MSSLSWSFSHFSMKMNSLRQRTEFVLFSLYLKDSITKTTFNGNLFVFSSDFYLQKAQGEPQLGSVFFFISNMGF